MYTKFVSDQNRMAGEKGSNQSVGRRAELYIGLVELLETPRLKILMQTVLGQEAQLQLTANLIQTSLDQDVTVTGGPDNHVNY